MGRALRARPHRNRTQSIKNIIVNNFARPNYVSRVASTVKKKQNYHQHKPGYAKGTIVAFVLAFAFVFALALALALVLRTLAVAEVPLSSFGLRTLATCPIAVSATSCPWLCSIVQRNNTTCKNHNYGEYDDPAVQSLLHAMQGIAKLSYKYHEHNQRFAYVVPLPSCVHSFSPDAEIQAFPPSLCGREELAKWPLSGLKVRWRGMLLVA